ncbi:UNVERIFIED_CONTAM: hypothetical protein FKN15_051925 [Acipenser sinensis]
MQPPRATVSKDNAALDNLQASPQAPGSKYKPKQRNRLRFSVPFYAVTHDPLDRVGEEGTGDPMGEEAILWQPLQGCQPLHLHQPLQLIQPLLHLRQPFLQR